MTAQASLHEASQGSSCSASPSQVTPVLGGIPTILLEPVDQLDRVHRREGDIDVPATHGVRVDGDDRRAVLLRVLELQVDADTRCQCIPRRLTKPNSPATPMLRKVMVCSRRVKNHRLLFRSNRIDLGSSIVLVHPAETVLRRFERRFQNEMQSGWVLGS